MSRQFRFSKGCLEVHGTRVFGAIKASTSMQQSPDNLVIDTTVDELGPISVNEVKQFRYVFALLGLSLCVVAGCLIGESVVMCSSGSGLGAVFESLEKMTVILPVSFAIGVGAYIIIFLKLRIYMAQFSNGGQTVYVPYIKKKDWIVFDDLNSTISELKRKTLLPDNNMLEEEQ